MVNTILYATDLGLYGPYMLEHVGDLAKSHNAQVYMLHVIEPLGVFADAVLETYITDDSKAGLRENGLNEVLVAIRAKVRAVFEQDLKDYDAETRWLKDVHVIGGSPAEVILTDAEAVKADLIVIGSHGGAKEMSTPLGSVASKVLQLSPIPVYMIPTATDRTISYHAVTSL
ncbi:hypothetical protein A9Q99_26515 [Gammaproteobacteria bacterium 45_16_T64]|nr:hypothetical protein A9Q99_26515 [Gammaproteobacteria bacterium 45_16_T64]